MSILSTIDNPLEHSDYFLGPVETIACSLSALSSGRLSLHDITEAYHTLSMRIRRSSSTLTVRTRSFPALEPLKRKGADVAAALRRDISWALHDSAPRASEDSSSSLSDEGVSWEPTAYNKTRAADLSTLCHYALRLLSEIFRLPVLSSVFSAQHLGSLLEDVISIVRCPRLPSFNASKTTTLASWIVRTQELPKAILLPRIKDIFLYLKFILEASAKRYQYNLYSLVSIARLADLIPSIFPFIMHSSSELRHHAATVLASFSQTLITHRTLVDEKTIETICYHTHSFLTPETTRHPTSSRKLPPLLESAVSSKSIGNVGENAPWAMTLIASFSVLLGPSLFLHRGPLKLVMNIAQKALRHHPGRELNPHVWRTFIWSMTQLYLQQGPTAEAGDDVVQRCVLVLKQAIHGGLGRALVWSLLGMTGKGSQNNGTNTARWVIPITVEIVRDMLSSKSQEIRDEACQLLKPLLSPFLFDGSLLHADKCQIEEMVRSTCIFSPRYLSPEEILSHWEPLSSCLVSVIQNCDSDLTTTVLPAWRSLLAVRTPLITLDGQSPTSVDFGSRLSSLLSRFLPDPSAPLSGDAESVAIQLRSLVVSKHLWAVVQSTFPRSWLTTVASSFLVATLQRTFYLVDQDVLRDWSLLCSALIIVGIPNVFELVPHLDDELGSLEIRRQLWRLVAIQCVKQGPGNFRNVISVLILPIGSWSMSEDDLDIWERLLEQGLSSGKTSDGSGDIVDDIASKFPIIGPSFPVSTALRIAIAILKYLDLREGDSTPTRMLAFLNATLVASYPPQSSTGDAVSALIRAIQHMIMSTPVSLLEPIVLAIQTGLAVWIEDQRFSLPGEAYNDILMPLYESLLQRLQQLSLSVTSLNALSSLLTSAFSHIPPPARGPAAFRRFFCAVHSGSCFSPPIVKYSDDLRVCIDACMRGYGGEWPSGMVPLSSQTQTQLQLQSQTMLLVDLLAESGVTMDVGLPGLEHEVVPDSQCPASNEVTPASQRARVQSAQAPLQPVDLSARLGSPDCRVSSESRNDRSLKRSHVSQDTPASKRRRAGPTNNRPYKLPAPLVRAARRDHRVPRSPSTPRTIPRTRLVMDCVEVAPLHEVLRRNERRAKRDNGRRPEPGGADDQTGREIMGAPKTPFVRRTIRERLERDEIVPETPDEVLRPIRTSQLRAAHKTRVRVLRYDSLEHVPASVHINNIDAADVTRLRTGSYRRYRGGADMVWSVQLPGTAATGSDQKYDGEINIRFTLMVR
ncbi:hypothetical protein EDB86DRAFT_3078209 [Lactarius hatsudake]|nr:hypothetical protein EDB86DRAFT_3078209 [Lactarius hatsudake]